MKLRLHHIEMCVKDPGPVMTILCQQFGLHLVGQRRTGLCEQFVVQLEKTIFIITSRRKSMGAILVDHENTKRVNHGSSEKMMKDRHELHEPWTVFCCDDKFSQNHIDSVFNIAIQVKDLTSCMLRLKQMGCTIMQDITNVCTCDGENFQVKYAIIKSCCGNLVHTLIDKGTYDGWFLPGFEQVSGHGDQQSCSTSYFDHVTLACYMGDSNSIIKWFQDAFEMKRFINNRQESEEAGLVIGGEVGMRLKVLEFWKCSEIGLASTCSLEEEEEPWEILKIVVVESLPLIKNTQVENFIRDHNGPGLQHIGIHTSNMIETVADLMSRGVRFRNPPPTYYTEIGQLNSINEVGVDPILLSKYGILLDTEADVFDDILNISNHTTNGDVCSTLSSKSSNTKRYLMQIFTHPIFDRDTFFLEIIQRKGARGFGVGNISALARSVNAYQTKLRECQRVTQENTYN